MDNIIFLKECNQKDRCGIKRCVHNRPHAHFFSCTSQKCDIGNNKELHCVCLKKRYKLVKE